MAKQKSNKDLSIKLMEYIGYIYGSSDSGDEDIRDYMDVINKMLNIAKRLNAPGFTKGYNEYLKDTGRGKNKDMKECKDIV